MEGLIFAASYTSIPCRDFQTNFTVCGWRGDEEDQIYSFPVKARINIQGIPFHHFNQLDISKLSKCANLLDISEDTSKKLNMNYASVMVGCDSLSSIPCQFYAVIGGQLCNIKMEIKL